MTQSVSHYRAVTLARRLGMKNVTRVSSGRYLKSKTGTDQVDLVVFQRYGRDCVGFEGRGEKIDVLNASEHRWNELGFHRHQATRGSHKTRVTFIQEHPPLPDGQISPRIGEAYSVILREFGETTD